MEKLDILNNDELTEEKIAELHNFYRRKNPSDPQTEIIFNRLAINERLMLMGYFRLNEDDKEVYIHIDGNIVEKVTSSQVISAFENFVKNLPPRHYLTEVSEYKITARQIREALYKNINSYMNSINRLFGDEPIEILHDDRQTKWLTFRNAAVKITANGYQLLPYEELPAKVWQSAVIDFDLHYTDTTGDFEKFIGHLCGEDVQRKQCLMQIMGYLLHDFYGNNRIAVLLTDAKTTGVGKATGGTGKSLIGKAMGQMLNRDRNAKNYVAVPGQDFDEYDSTRYSMADQTTHLIHIEDAHKNFDFVQLFNDVTDGATVRQLHHDRYIIDAKIFLSSNMTMDLSAPSTQRRLFVFEVLNYYGVDFTPEQEFGKRFFEDQWNEIDWNQFYSFMVRCIIAYLKHGIQRPAEINYSARRIDEVFYTREDFRYWFEEKLSDAFAGKEVEFAKGKLRTEFVQRYQQYDNPKFVNTFTKWCKEYLQLAGLDFVEIRGTVDTLIVNPSEFNKQRATPRKKATQSTLDI